MMTEEQAARPVTRATQRPAAAFDDYVLRYGRAQRVNLFLIFAGAALAVGAVMQLTGGAAVIVAAVGLGVLGAGGGGLLIAAGAHASYTRHLGVTTTRAYAEPPPAVRPFVPSRNPSTVRAGRFQLPATTWAALFATAEGNGGRLTRDAAAKVLPRDLYRDWQSTLAELQRLGMVDDDGRVTEGGRRFIRRDVSPYPIGGNSAARAHGTHARRTHDAHGGGGGQ